MNWISVKDRLPDIVFSNTSEYCIVFHGTKLKPEGSIAQYDHYLKGWFDHWNTEIKHVTHWLPYKPPKK